jgi:hydrogenase maturation protein HypF
MTNGSSDDDLNAAMQRPGVRHGVAVRVRGIVQGVGFRPAVWRLATETGLSGDVRNDAEGVLIRIVGPLDGIETFLARLSGEPPPLARIDAIETTDLTASLALDGFSILESVGGAPSTAVAPDAAVCADCLAEMARPGDRRSAHPFITCTHCGPRFTIVEAVPYDRTRTTMARFPLCPACAAEYADPADRRYHAEAIACPDCGPRLRFAGPGPDGHPIARAVDVLRGGGVLALKGLGGYQLACDATDTVAVARLRERKRRDTKPFALMVRDVDRARAICAVSDAEARLLASAEGPIVLLRRRPDGGLPDGVAPGMDTLGVMLPTTPLHRLLFAPFDGPLVMTSGNLSDAPQETDDDRALDRLGGIADGFLLHDRPIAVRIDDSVARVVAGRPRTIRRARGLAPAPLPLPPGFDRTPPILAMGGQLKAAVCITRADDAILSEHVGDLDDPATADELAAVVDRYARLFGHAPAHVAVDGHPDYRSTALGRVVAARHGATLHMVAHHHAHMAACLFENGVPLGAPPVLGLALDGIGLGEDGALWGCELLLGGYREVRRVGTLVPSALPGGDQAAREPWRNLFAQLDRAFGWETAAARFADVPAVATLGGRPVGTLAAMIRTGLNAPPASSCGRLFDAVAAALGLAPQRIGWEGEAAARLEAAVDRGDGGAPHPFAIVAHAGIAALDPAPMWAALLDEVRAGVPVGAVAARFHRGLATALVDLALQVAPDVRTVALTGGCLQNAVLHELLETGFAAHGRRVLTHASVPANDGGLALGQAAVVAARLSTAGGT